MPSNAPSLRISLATDGTLVLELPGVMDSARFVRMKPGEVETTLHRVLQAQQGAQCALGEDGAPTQAQVTHWNRHGIFADPRCPHCRAEGRGGSGRSHVPKARPTILAQGEGVTIRRLPSKGAKRADKAERNLIRMTTTYTAEELDL